MDDNYRIELAKTEISMGHITTEMRSRLSPSLWKRALRICRKAGRAFMMRRQGKCFFCVATELFAEYSVKLTVIIIDIKILGDRAYDFGWHEFTLKPKGGGEIVRKRHRYFEVWKKNSSGEWKISLFINNADVREELGGHASHWFRAARKSPEMRAVEEAAY